MSEYFVSKIQGFPEHTFEIVNHIPLGYHIWNIGKHIEDGYLPLCQMIGGTYTINSNTLKAIKIPEAQIILSAIGVGPETPEQMEKYIEKHKNDNPNSWEYSVVKKMNKALPFMKKLKWN